MTSKKALINAHMMKTSHTGLLYLFSGPDNNPNLIIAMTTAKPYIGHTGPKRKPLFTQCLYLILQKTHSQIQPANEKSINALKYCATNNLNYLVYTLKVFSRLFFCLTISASLRPVKSIKLHFDRSYFKASLSLSSSR